jgi:hypothetical protein
MEKTLAERVEYESLGRDFLLEGRFIQGFLQFRVECDDHLQIS